MRLIHSIWTRPLFHGKPSEVAMKIAVNCWCYALSYAYAKYLNLPIKLMADTTGQKILSFIPYDEVETISVPIDTPTAFWAAGKFKAYEKMIQGDVHIDGDVFIKKENLPLLIDAAINGDYELICQCVEDKTNCDSKYYNRIIDIFNTNNITYDGLTIPKFESAYNTGLISFNSETLKKRYIENYWNTVKQTQGTQAAYIFKMFRLVPDLVLEQQMLYETAKELNTYTLLGKGDVSYQYSSAIGYQHLIGKTKQQELDKVIGTLYKLDKDLFTQCNTTVNTYINNINESLKCK